MRGPSGWLSLAIVLVCPSVPAQWVQTQGPEGAYVLSLAEDDAFIYAASSGAVFRMHKGDSTWALLPELNKNLAGAYSLAVKGTTLLAGTNGGGVYWSSDHGATWASWLSGLDLAQSVFCFAVIGGDLFAGTNRGVYLSKDNGANWSPANAGLPAGQVVSLLVKGSNLFAGFLNYGVYRSSNHGTSWTPAYNGLPTDTPWLRSLAVLDSSIFAATWWGDGVYRSSDDGMNWEPVNYGLLNPDVNTLAVLGTNLLAGTFGGMFLSTNQGETWNRLDYGGPPSIVNCLYVSGTEIFAGAFDGVYVSTDAGDRWRCVRTGLIGTVINVIVHNGTTIFAGTGSSGLFHSHDDGVGWARTDLQTTDVTSLVISGSEYFAGTSGGVSRSTDAGDIWTSPRPVVSSELIPLGRGATGVTTLALESSRAGGLNLFAGTGSCGVYLSTDSGNTWAAMNSGLADTSVRCLAMIDTSLFAGTASGVFLSTNGGASWSPVNRGLPVTPVQSFAVGGGKIFAGTDDSGVFLSADFGTSWAPVNKGLTDLNVLCLAARGTTVIAGTWSDGVFLSENSGVNWVRVQTGLRGLPILALDIGDASLFAGSRGAGVWRRPLSEMITSVEPVTTEFSHEFRLRQNYPNPFNPGTTINFELPKPADVRLSVYDLLGREVSVIVNERRDAGVHEVKFDASGLSSGVYFYRLQAGDFVSTRRMLWLK